MTLVSMSWDPGPRTLRQFGFIGAGLLALLGGWIAWRHAFIVFELEPASAAATARWLWGAAGVLAVLALLRPALLLPVHLVLSALALPVGLVLSNVVVVLMFFGVLLPVGLAFRLLGRDLLERRLDRSAGSYWRPRTPPGSAKQYYHPY